MDEHPVAAVEFQIILSLNFEDFGLIEPSLFAALLSIQNAYRKLRNLETNSIESGLAEDVGGIAFLFVCRRGERPKSFELSEIASVPPNEGWQFILARGLVETVFTLAVRISKSCYNVRFV